MRSGWIKPITMPLRLGVLVVLWPTATFATPTQPGQLSNLLEEGDKCIAFCHVHGNLPEHMDDPYYAAGTGWKGSLMANSARDPVFWAAVALAAQDDPEHTQECIRCHSPRAYLEGRGDATTIEELTPTDLDGVSCDLCHRMMDDGAIGNAQYTIDDVAVGGNVPRRGPWDYTDGSSEPEHAWMYDSFLGTSQSCGVCHDVTTPRERVDDGGTPMGIAFGEQRTYSEWNNSSFAVPGDDFRSCQDCHMPAVANKPGCKSRLDANEPHADGGRRHDLVGANRFMIEVIKGLYGSEGTGEIDDGFFDISLERTDALLQTAARLEVNAPVEVDLTKGLSGLDITVENLTGHKLPTGYSEGRVMWIEVQARYGEALVWSSGLWDADAGIQDDDQLRTYDALAEDFSDGTTFHLLRNNHWVRDTRIPPRGLRPDPQTDPVGDRYALQPDGTWPHFDRHTYAFEARPDVADTTPSSSDGDTLELTVRLRYLINTPEYIDALREDNTTNNAGGHLAELFEQRGGAPALVLAEQTLQLPITGFGSVVEITTEGSTTGPNPGSTSTNSDASSGSESGAATETSAGCGCDVNGRQSVTGFVGLLLLVGIRRRWR